MSTFEMLVRVTSLLQFPNAGGVAIPLDRIDIPGLHLNPVTAALEEVL